MNKLAVVLAAVCFILTAQGSPAVAKTAFDLGTASVGARGMGMGRAVTAVADDVNAVFTNPAGLAKQKNWGMTSMSTKMMNRVDYKLVGATYPTQYGTFGVGYLSALTPAGYLTTDKNSLANATPISYGSTQLSLSYGVDLSDVIMISRTAADLSLGATYHTTTSKFEGYDGSGNGSGLDIGLIFRPNSIVTTGLTLQNIGGGVNWSNGSQENLPMATKLGVACDLNRTRLAVDYENGANGGLLHGGVEYRPFDLMALRLGAEQTPTGNNENGLNLTAGVGFQIAGFKFDYAYRQDSVLADNSNHYFSISYQPELPRSFKSAVEKTVPAQTEVARDTRPVQVDGLFRTNGKKPVVSTPTITSVPAEQPTTAATVSPAPASDTNTADKDILSYYGIN